MTQNKALNTAAESLREKKRESDAVVKEKVTESKLQKKEVDELKEKIRNLEHALSSVVRLLTYLFWSLFCCFVIFSSLI